MPRVTFLPGGVSCEVGPGTSVFEAGARVSAGIDTACVGKGTCGLCRVKIIAGAEQLPALTEEETRHLGNVYHLNRVRLACRTVVAADVTVEVLARRRRPGAR